MKKYLTLFIGILLLSTSTVLANSIELSHDGRRATQYGIGESRDYSYDGNTTKGLKITTTYTLGNSRARGAAYVKYNNQILESVKVTRVNEPETAEYVTTNINIRTYHKHQVSDYMPY